MKYTYLLPALVVVLTGAAAIGVNQVSAQEGMNSRMSGEYPPIVQKLVTKFGLQENEVRALFDEERQERGTQMKAKFEERLTQLVSDGKITEAQKQLIISKHQELQAQRGTEQTATHEEKRAELEAWAKDNGIDVQYLMFGKGGPGPHRR